MSVSTASVTLTAAQIKTGGNKVQLLAAPGAVLFYKVLNVEYHYNFGTAFFSGGGPISVVYSGYTSQPIFTMPASFVLSTSALAVGPSLLVGTASNESSMVNQALEVNGSGFGAGGDGTLTVTIAYTTETF